MEKETMEYIKQILDSSLPLTMVSKEHISQLIEDVEHLQFENEIIRRNRTQQERKDFNRIKQLEAEIKTLKSLSRLKTKYKMDENGNLERVGVEEE